jgi:teichuronic acid biosynthesis glycosyltransferase TuaC
MVWSKAQKIMKILVICSGNYKDFNFETDQAFISDQIKACESSEHNMTFDLLFIKGEGYKGYWKNIPKIKKRIAQFKPDLIHAHGGHIGLLCCLQRIKPVVVTFHGSDINVAKSRILSSIASMFSAASIFVSSQLSAKCFFKKKSFFIVPCGVDFNVFFPMEKNRAKLELGIDPSREYILFSASFENQVKNFPLARKALSCLPEILVREISGKTRQEVNLLINGAELLLLTSFTEGSPQIIKEAMACNCPIVATDVGDIREVVKGIPGCFLTGFDPADVAEKIKTGTGLQQAVPKAGKRSGIWITGLVAKKIINVYKTVLN